MSTVLNKILSCDGERYYDIVEIDKYYTNLKREVIDEKTLISRYNNTEGILDFEVSNGVLRCNSLQKEVSCSHSEIIRLTGKVESCKAEKGSIYEFLEYGAENDYLFVELDENNQVVSRAPFINTKFSRSTMTVQVYLASEESIHNLVIIHNRGGVLQMNKFHYAVPKSKIVCNENDAVTRFEYNGDEFLVFETGELKLFENEKFIAPAINQCAASSVKVNDALKTMKDFKTALYRQDTTTTWEGGTRSYKDEPAVEFESTCKKLTMRQRNYLVSNALDVIEGRSITFKDVVKNDMEVTGWDTPSANMSVNLLDMVVSSPREEMFQRLLLLIKTLETNAFFWDLFLYRMRVFILLTEYLPVNKNSPYLVGGNTMDFTAIKTRFIGE